MSNHHPSRLAASAVLLGVCVLALGARAAESAGTSVESPETRVMDLSRVTDIAGLLDRIADRRVIFVGEKHDRYEDHLTQLAVIQGMVERGKAVAVGMEFFQQPYQAELDAYVAGTIDEAEFLERTQYFDRWRFDYRLYRPILSYAREHRIPLIALNLESEITARVGAEGIESLNAAERKRLPADMDRADPAYRARIERVFKQHPAGMRANFDRFLEVQLLWDEGMAERAAQYLAQNPERTLFVLAGGGHVEYGQGIPKRLLRRVQASSVILMNGRDRTPEPTAADFFLYPLPASLPAAGMLGIMLDETGGKGMLVKGFGEPSGAKNAGVHAGDRIVRVGDRPVADYADIRIALLDGKAGQRVPVDVLRKDAAGAEQPLTLQVTLH